MLIVELNHKELINQKLNVDGFIIGVDYLSSDVFLKFTLDEAIALAKKIKSQNKIVMIDCTNIFSDQELKKVNEMLDYINHEVDIDYYLYEDLGLMPLIDKSKRMYYSLTYTTNKEDLNIVLKENRSALISPLVKEEYLKSLSQNTNTFVIGFGTWRIFYSRRSLITNYFVYRNGEKEDGNYMIKEENRPDEAYPIIENYGTKIYLHDYFYLNDELKSYANLILKPFNLDFENTCEVINLYLAKLKDEAINLDEKLSALNIKHHQALLHQDSILIKKEKARWEI